MIDVNKAKRKINTFEFSSDMTERHKRLLRDVLDGKTTLSRDLMNQKEMFGLSLFYEKALARHGFLAEDQVNGIIGSSTVEATKLLLAVYGLNPERKVLVDQDVLLSLLDGTLAALKKGDHDSFYQKCRNYAKARGMVWHDEEGYVNLVAVRGYAIAKDGKSGYDIKNVFNIYNDALFWCYKKNGKEVVESFLVSVDPGYYYKRIRPLNRKGAAHLANGQWFLKRGKHGRSQYPALVQSRPVTVYRTNKDEYKPTDFKETGWFGINHHAGTNGPTVYNASAGCVVLKCGGYRSQEWLTYIDRLYRFKNTEFALIVADNI